jgi:nucleolin
MTEQVISQTKLFVSGLAWKMRGLQLREEFEKCGEVVFARVVLDNETGRSRGFGFVEFVNAEDATKAKEEMSDSVLWEREIKVDFAKENPEKFQARQEENTEEATEEEAEAEGGDE